MKAVGQIWWTLQKPLAQSSGKVCAVTASIRALQGTWRGCRRERSIEVSTHWCRTPMSIKKFPGPQLRRGRYGLDVSQAIVDRSKMWVVSAWYYVAALMLLKKSSASTGRKVGLTPVSSHSIWIKYPSEIDQVEEYTASLLTTEVRNPLMLQIPW